MWLGECARTLTELHLLLKNPIPLSKPPQGVDSLHKIILGGFAYYHKEVPAAALKGGVLESI